MSQEFVVVAYLDVFHDCLHRKHSLRTQRHAITRNNTPKPQHSQRLHHNIPASAINHRVKERPFRWQHLGKFLSPFRVFVADSISSSQLLCFVQLFFDPGCYVDFGTVCDRQLKAEQSDSASDPSDQDLIAGFHTCFDDCCAPGC